MNKSHGPQTAQDYANYDRGSGEVGHSSTYPASPLLTDSPQTRRVAAAEGSEGDGLSRAVSKVTTQGLDLSEARLGSAEPSTVNLRELGYGEIGRRSGAVKPCGDQSEVCGEISFCRHACEQPDDAPPVADELDASFHSVSGRRLGIAAERQYFGDRTRQCSIVNNDIGGG
jgi:hypothetical protein